MDILNLSSCTTLCKLLTDLKKKPLFRKHHGRRKQTLITSTFSFPTTFSSHLKTSFNFSFMFYFVVCNAVKLDICKVLLFGKGLTLSQMSSCFHMSSLLKTLGKGDIARNEQCLLFLQCFLPFWRTRSFSSHLKFSSASSEFGRVAVNSLPNDKILDWSIQSTSRGQNKCGVNVLSII